jgi:hypothetical protein
VATGRSVGMKRFRKSGMAGGWLRAGDMRSRRQRAVQGANPDEDPHQLSSFCGEGAALRLPFKQKPPCGGSSCAEYDGRTQLW